MPVSIKVMMDDTIVKSTLKYEAEAWRLIELDKRRIDTVMDALSKSSGKTRLDRPRNTTITDAKDSWNTRHATVGLLQSWERY